MEKVTTSTRQITEVCHQFFCDDCGEELGTSFEFDDGYYETFGEFEAKAYLGGEWYKLKATLCTTCRKAKQEKLKEVLTQLGFQKD